MNKMRTRNKNIFYFIGGLLIALSSCTNFLDVVPDNTTEIQHLFETREKAFNALSTCYSYMPFDQNFHNDMVLAGDEWVPRLDAEVAGKKEQVRGCKIMEGWQNSNDPQLSTWDGNGGGRDLYEGIRQCNIFLKYVDIIPNITDEEKADWVAQVTFLKSYYHFSLIKNYGPIIIMDKNVEASDGIQAVRHERQPVDSCFNYVVSLIDQSLKAMPDFRNQSYQGQIDKTVALAVKAKVLVYAASPLFNGNSEFYSTFTNEQGEPYFNMNYNKEKWKKAADALDVAIAQAEGKGNRGIYIFDGKINAYDVKDWEQSGIMKSVYNAKYSILDSWNSEIVWGYSNIDDRFNGCIQTATNMRSTEELGKSGNCWQWLGASYRMTELFHTKNGVPIDEDITYSYDDRQKVITVPEDDNYHLGFIQPLEKTIKLHLNREPRFYAWLATDRSIWRTHDVKNDTKMRVSEAPGGKRIGDNKTDFYWSGIAVKKWVHPETMFGGWTERIIYPKPIIRMADLYLMRAEANNEYNGPQQKVYDDLNKVRARVNLPKVEEVYSNAKIVKNVGKHTTKSGLRSIIHQERLIELSFEGHRYYDILRWKRAAEFFNSPLLGWDIDKSSADDFYVLSAKQLREFETPRNYLFPIKLSELTMNPKLVQNPGWSH
ncbi:RagB/SusD family nutrient uptake outer membrane protein [Prolixibacteraceae bacterium JC049]|nr:RagB/SusD family nutrient uptake outer membrane protein [Prolixibacteraceae bacterium JC049]